MTTKPEMTLENVCFRYDGSKEAKECFGAFRDATKCLWSPQDGMIYGIVDNKPKIDFVVPIGFTEVSPSDYLLLLSAPESQSHLMTEKDLIVGNRFECIEEFIYERNIFYYKGRIYDCRIGGRIRSANGFDFRFNTLTDLNRHFKLVYQPPVMEGKEEKITYQTTLTDKELINLCDEWVSKMCKTGGKAFTMSVPVRLNYDTDVVLSALINRFSLANKTIQSLQSEVEQLKGLLKEAQPFCGTMLRGKIEHYTSK